MSKVVVVNESSGQVRACGRWPSLLNVEAHLIDARRWATLVAMLLLAPALTNADSAPYSQERTIRAKGAGVLAVHKHNWASEKPKHLFLNGESDSELFGAGNDFSTVTISEEGGDPYIVTRPVPPLTHIVVLDDGELIVGLSNIKIYNPFQIVAFDRDGNLLLAEHVPAREACLSDSEVEEFRRTHPAAANDLKTRITRFGGVNYVDYARLGAPKDLGEAAWDYLYSRDCASRYSPHIAETVTNYVYWYNDEPDVRLETLPNSGTRFIVVRGRKGEEIRFELRDR